MAMKYIISETERDDNQVERVTKADIPQNSVKHIHIIASMVNNQ